MERKHIVAQLKKILVEDLFVGDTTDDIAETSHLGTDLGLDSVGFVELATIVGETFGIQILDGDLGKGHFTTVEQITDFVVARSGEAPAV